MKTSITPISVYGLYTPMGVCLYVGQTRSPKQRLSHHKAKKGKFASWSELTMRVFKIVWDRPAALRLEKRITRQMNANGEAIYSARPNWTKKRFLETHTARCMLAFHNRYLMNNFP